MKDLQDYILESLGIQTTPVIEALDEEETLKHVEIKFDGPRELYIQIPEAMSESDVQIYLDDTLLKNMPGEIDEKALGENFKLIEDAYFEYDRMEMTFGASQKADILWDDHYDQSLNATSMKILRIANLKYVLKFTEFKLKLSEDDDSEDTIKEILFKLFNGVTVETNKEIPFEIKIDKNNITFER